MVRYDIFEKVLVKLTHFQSIYISNKNFFFPFITVLPLIRSNRHMIKKSKSISFAATDHYWPMLVTILYE